ncbi:class II glutamine amidotransferase [Streptomyces sp. NPDC056632]|uniref:class II glutamine amidotransferase n=1 Tax=Streptomyces sp. NPDC056632 TaxID=3345884 RepID=UPI0036AE2D94
MCRLLGVVAAEAAPVSELLADQLGPFLALAGEHRDGWGLALQAPNGSIRRVRGLGRADHSPHLAHVLRSWRTRAAILHLRKATPGLAVDARNTHPFGTPHLALAHNGAFAPVEALDALIGPELLARAEGTTDSERLQLAVRARTEKGMPAGQALEAVAADIRRLATSYVSANTLLLTPEGLFAYADHDPESEVSRRRGLGYFGLDCLRPRPDRTVIASAGHQPAPTTWHRLPERRTWHITPTCPPSLSPPFEVATPPSLHPRRPPGHRGDDERGSECGTPSPGPQSSPHGNLHNPPSPVKDDGRASMTQGEI